MDYGLAGRGRKECGESCSEEQQIGMDYGFADGNDVARVAKILDAHTQLGWRHMMRGLMGGCMREKRRQDNEPEI
jgi:hypothetical protein